MAQRALELRDEGLNLNEMAVLYRSHFHALELQLELTRRNIPFAITSGIRFFEQAHIKDVAAYLKLVINPLDELAFKRLARLLPGIGGKSADKLWTCFNAQFRVSSSASLSTAAADQAADQAAATETKDREPIRNPQSAIRNPLAAVLQSCAASVPKKAATAWDQFTATVAQLEAEPVRGQTAEMIRLVLDAGYEEYLQDNYANYRTRLEDIEQLAQFARQFQTVEEFLAQMALLTNLEADEDRPAVNDTEQIRLSTIHQAKGLEFKVVFVIMLCDRLFPSARSLKSQEGEEEERRLFYVAITRAKNELYLTYPLIRSLSGGSGADWQQPSRFLKEIPEDLRDEWNLKPFNAYG